jgi:acyl-CoA dehydrogenase
MGWDFETDADYQAELDWVDAFVRHEVQPVDLLIGNARDSTIRCAAS